MIVAATAPASSARAELLYKGHVDGARLSSGGSGWDAAYVLGSNVHVVGRSRNGAAIGFPGAVELDGLAGPYVLGRARDGSWLALWDGRVLRRFHRDSRQARFGPAGLALDANGLPIVAYPLWFPSHRTFLRLARVSPDGLLRVQRVTKGGFPSSPTLPAAAPVVLRSGAVRVVQTYARAAIDWGLTGWGKLLFASALGIPAGGVAAVAEGDTVHAAWTEEFPTLGPPAVVLATHADRVRSGIALENAVLAALALTPEGLELAANRCIPAAAFGATGNGICGALIGDVGVDGIVAGYAYADTMRELLLQTDTGLEWFATSRLATRVVLNPDLTGRVNDATGGTVTIYRERPGEPRTAMGSVPLAADGTFSIPAPASPLAAAYRAVYTDPLTRVPYAALIGP